MISKKFKRIIRSSDIFGQKVELNINCEGTQHQTQVGGAISILVMTLLFFYFAELIKKMVNHNDDKNYQIEFLVDKDENGANISNLIKVNEIGVSPYFILYSPDKNNGFMVPIIYGREAR